MDQQKSTTCLLLGAFSLLQCLCYAALVLTTIEVYLSMLGQYLLLVVSQLLDKLRRV
jgi:hypothetical protein